MGTFAATSTANHIKASPFDSVWGIGFNKDKANKNRSSWGANLLGKALMRVREELKKRLHEQDAEIVEWNQA